MLSRLWTQRQQISKHSWQSHGNSETSQTVSEALAHQIATIGENMNIRRFAQVTEENGMVSAYTHMGGKIGVLVDVVTDVVNDAVKEMAKNICHAGCSSETSVHKQC